VALFNLGGKFGGRGKHMVTGHYRRKSEKGLQKKAIQSPARGGAGKGGRPPGGG